MDETELVVTRNVDLDLSADELWAMVSDGATWADWLATEADVEVVAGASGTVVDDDGSARDVAVDWADPASGIGFRWWPTDDPAQHSAVELQVIELPAGSRLLIRETFPLIATAATTATRAAATEAMAITAVRAWEVRALCLWIRSLARVSA